jgi:hypothetical protein
MQRMFKAVVLAARDCRDKEARVVRSALFAVLVALVPALAIAQITPAAGYTPPDDTPSIRVGVTIYADYTYADAPEVRDADGNTIHPNAFNVTRAYINVTGNLSHIVAFRVTPDIVRQSGLITLVPPDTITNDSLMYRIKYAYFQFNLDDWMTKGSWARFGIQQTPFLDYSENIYRYRFQGTTFTEREGFYNSADGGASFHYNFPSNYGDVHVGVFNGEGYAKTDPNDQKAIEIRGTVRPFATQAPILRGLRVTAFYFGDNYIRDSERTRAVAQVTFEQKYINAGWDYIDAHDQPAIAARDVEAKGWSFWATPKKPYANGSSVEALLRYDHLDPDAATNEARPRTIIGLAYWFPHQGNTVACTMMLDYEGQTFSNFPIAQPTQKRIAIHGQIIF